MTRRAVSTISFTVTDWPEPRMTGPVWSERHAAKIPLSTSSTWITSRIMVPSPRTLTPVPSRAARISRGMKLSLCCIPGP